MVGEVVMPISGKEMVKLLKAFGFEEVGQKGIHLKMKNDKTGRTVIIPIHSKDLGKGLEHCILKQAGLED